MPECGDNQSNSSYPVYNPKKKKIIASIAAHAGGHSTHSAGWHTAARSTGF